MAPDLGVIPIFPNFVFNNFAKGLHTKLLTLCHPRAAIIREPIDAILPRFGNEFTNDEITVLLGFSE